MNPKYHYDNIGQLLAKHPPLIGVIEQHGIPEPTTNSQLDDLKSPNATIDTYGNVFSLFQSKNLRWQGNQRLAEMDQDARGQVFKANGDHYHFALNMLWDLVEPTTKRDLFGAKHLDPASGLVVDKKDVQSYLTEYSSAWHLLNKPEERVMHMDAVTQLANYHKQNTAYDSHQAIQKSVNSLYGFMVTGRNDSSGAHHGLPKKVAGMYGITGNQVVAGAERSVVETLMKYKPEQFDLLGSERLTTQQKQMFLEEAFKNRGTIQVDAVLAEDGNRWKLVLREYEEQEDWYPLPNDYLPLNVLGDLLINGEPAYIPWNEAQRMSLSAEIVSGLHQIEETKGNKFSSIWEDLMTHEKEYLGTYNEAPTIRPDTLSGQQFPKTDIFKGFLLGAMQNFSKAQVDFVLKPMIEHFRKDRGDILYESERYISDPTDDQIRDYINNELAKHGDRTTKIKEYFSINQHTFSFLFEAPMTPEQTIETDENLIPFL